MSNMTLAQQFADLNATIPDVLGNQHADLRDRGDALSVEFINNAPESIDDDEAEKAATDLGARINSFLQLVDGQRKNAKDEPAKSPKLIDDFFRGISGGLVTKLEVLRSRVNTYKNAKIAEQRRQQAEAARIAANERARAERERQEAERLRREAEEARIREAEAAKAEDRPAEPTPEELAAQDAERESDRQAQLAADAAKAATPVVAPMVRAESGAKSGQLGTWKGRIDDEDALVKTMGPVGPYIPKDDLQKAINKMARIHKGAMQVVGVTFYEDFTTTFRS